jgi:hypothetical protein
MKGVIIVEADYCLLPVTYKGTLAWMKVDDDVAEWASRHSWCLRGASSAYAVSKIGGKVRQLHVLVNQTPSGMDTDHINGRSLDNRRDNLRSATRSQNTLNRHRQTRPHGGASRPRVGEENWVGISRKSNEPRRRPWFAGFEHGGKRHSVGYFADPEDAATAYNLAASRLLGPTAVLNVPTGPEIIWDEEIPA